MTGGMLHQKKPSLIIKIELKIPQEQLKKNPKHRLGFQNFE